MRLKAIPSEFTPFLLLVFFTSTIAAYPQFPTRVQIPGALLLESPRPVQTRPRGRVAQPHLLQEVRPVIEEPEDVLTSIRLIPAPQPSPIPQQVQQLVEIEPEDVKPQLAFRPERPLAIARNENPRQIGFSQSVPIRPLHKQQQQQATFISPAEIPHLRRPPAQPVQQPQVRPAPRPAARPAPQYLDEEGTRTRKPPVQILRKYRTDNADGSITWGYENEDGSFKEETIGIDCITRGKYGYVDPDGVKREYTYETGAMCEEPEEELEDLPPGQQPQAAPKGKKTLRAPPSYA